MLILLLLAVFDLLCESASLSVAPTHFEFEGSPGLSMAEKITLYNTSDHELLVRLYRGDFWYNRRNERTFPDPGTTPFSAASWVSIESREVLIPKRSQKAVAFVFAIPPTAKASGYASLFVEEVNPTASGNTVGVSLRIAIPLLYHRPGATFDRTQLKLVKVNKPTAFRPMLVAFKIQNREDTYTFPEGDLLIVKGDKKEFVAKAELKRDRLVLPAQELQFDLPLLVEPKPGKYEGILTIHLASGASRVQSFHFNLP